VNWALDTARGALGPSVDWAALLTHGGYLVALAAALVVLSSLTFRSYQRSV